MALVTAQIVWNRYICEEKKHPLTQNIKHDVCCNSRDSGCVPELCVNTYFALCNMCGLVSSVEFYLMDNVLV